MTAYPCCECCLTDPMHPDQHEVNCPTCDNPVADRLRAERGERGELAAKLAHMREARDNARAEVERLTAVVRRVRELHRESRGSMSALYPSLICECGKDYPCPTIRALAAAGGVS